MVQSQKGRLHGRRPSIFQEPAPRQAHHRPRAREPHRQPPQQDQDGSQAAGPQTGKRRPGQGTPSQGQRRSPKQGTFFLASLRSNVGCVGMLTVRVRCRKRKRRDRRRSGRRRSGKRTMRMMTCLQRRTWICRATRTERRTGRMTLCRVRTTSFATHHRPAFSGPHHRIHIRKKLYTESGQTQKERLR